MEYLKNCSKELQDNVNAFAKAFNLDWYLNTYNVGVIATNLGLTPLTVLTNPIETIEKVLSNMLFQQYFEEEQLSAFEYAKVLVDGGEIYLVFEGEDFEALTDAQKIFVRKS